MGGVMRGRRRISGVLGAVLAVAMLAVPGVSWAGWHRAETDRFIVFGEGREARVRDYALKLSAFDLILRYFHPTTLDKVPATKLSVYLLNGRDDLRRVRPGMPRDSAGFYVAMNEGVFAIGLDSREGIGGDDIMFHEYAHHFMLENFPAAYPAWFVEGFAEYFMTTEVTPQKIKIGGFNPGRVQGLFSQPWVSLESLLSQSVGETRPDMRAAYYAQAWLLMHYMRATPERQQQLDTAARAIAGGDAPVTAMREAMGADFDTLTRKLRAYRTISVATIDNPLAKTPPMVTVTPLPTSANDLLIDDLRLILSPTGQVDGAFLADVRRKAARYPGDRLADMAHARAEFVMGDPAAGEAIMNRLLAAAPSDHSVHLLAGTGQMMAGMRDRAAREARMRAARPLLAKAHKLDENDFRALFAYAYSRSIEPKFPNENDLNVLLLARRLAPSVGELSLRAGEALLARGDREGARRVLTPLINNPHGGVGAAHAKALVEGKSGPQAQAAGEAADVERSESPKPAAPIT